MVGPTASRAAPAVARSSLCSCNSPVVHHQIVQVSVLYFASCPNWQETGRRVRAALDQAGYTGTAVTFVPVESLGQAAAVVLRGSPTITVDGEDLFPARLPPVGLNCRLYPTTNGPAGVPDLIDLIAALRERGTS
jgi:hypothetical protein